MVHQFGIVSPSSYGEYKSVAFEALKSVYDGGGGEDAGEEALKLLIDVEMSEWGGGDLLALVMDVLTNNDRSDDALQLFYADYRLEK